MDRVAGVDGCRGGWVVATGDADGRDVSVIVVSRFDSLVGGPLGPPLAAVAVDMPIGLADAGSRACDREARRLIGPRRASVFPAPARSVLGSATYSEACAASRAVSGVAISRQAFGLLAKIAEVDAVVDPLLQEVVREAHPEGSFTELGGAPCPSAKRTVAGRAQRLARLATGFDALPGAVAGAAPDDVLDAVVLLWTARRMARGHAVCVGDGATDRRGLRMEIWR